MTTSAAVNLIVDEIISRLNTNATALGGVLAVKEKSEDPAVVANFHAALPIIYVIPLADTKEKIQMTMQGGGDNIHNNFTVTIAGYYHFADVDNYLRTLRGYAYDVVDLFSGTGNQVSIGNVYAADLEVGYFTVVDNVIHSFNLKLYIKFVAGA